MGAEAGRPWAGAGNSNYERAVYREFVVRSV